MNSGSKCLVGSVHCTVQSWKSTVVIVVITVVQLYSCNCPQYCWHLLYLMANSWHEYWHRERLRTSRSTAPHPSPHKVEDFGPLPSSPTPLLYTGGGVALCRYSDSSCQNTDSLSLTYGLINMYSYLTYLLINAGTTNGSTYGQDNVGYGWMGGRTRVRRYIAR
jgi:hypothetical protein